MQTIAEPERNGASRVGDFPREGEAGFEGLRLTIETNQNAAGEIANGFGGVILDEQRVKSLWFAAEAEVEFATGLDGGLGLTERRADRDNNKSECNPYAAHH